MKKTSFTICNVENCSKLVQHQQQGKSQIMVCALFSSFLSLPFFPPMEQRSFCRVKVTTVSVHSMKAFRKSRRTALLALNIGDRWTWVVNFTPRPLYPRGKRRGTYQREGWDEPHSWSGQFGEQKNSLPLQGKEPRMVQPVA